MGEGYVFLYNLSSEEQRTIWEDNRKTSGLTVMMLVDYQHSPIGPYEELLLIPGQIEHEGRRGYSISHIHVSTEVSTINGRKHWAIPKVTSSFVNQSNNASNATTIIDKKNRTTVIETKSRSIKIPVFTHLLPYRLLQLYEGTCFQLRPTATGFTRLASLTHFESNQPGFERLAGKKPIVGLHATTFRMLFPPALPT